MHSFPSGTVAAGALLSYVCRPGMRVYFVSGIDGFCHRYQVLHRAAQLGRLGHECAVRHAADPRWPGELSAYDALVLYRVPHTPHVAAGIAAARERRIPAIGSIDDLLFLPDDGLFPELAALPAAERELWLDGVRRYRATLAACDAFLAPTTPLVEAAAELGWHAVLHRNSVTPVELALGAAARARRAREGSAAPRAASVVLGYFSGTPTHDADFASIAPALAQVMRDAPQARLRVVGPLTLPPPLAALGARVERRPLVAWTELPDLVADVDLSLAPLDLGRRFAQAKGEVKYLEAAAASVPTIASPSPAYRHAIRHRENGCLAASPEEWVLALRELILDPGLRRRLGAAARADVESRYDETSRGRELAASLAALRDAVKYSSSRAAAVESAAPHGAVSDAVSESGLACHALEPEAFPVAFEEECTPLLDDALLRLVSPPLAPGRTLAQRLRARRNGLCRVDVHTVTYGLAPAYTLELRLLDEDGALLAASRYAARLAPDRGWLALDVPLQAASRGRSYRFEVRALDAPPGAALSFGLTPAAPGAEPARIDGEDLAGVLRVRGFADSGCALAEVTAGAPARSRG